MHGASGHDPPITHCSQPSAEISRSCPHTHTDSPICPRPALPCSAPQHRKPHCCCTDIILATATADSQQSGRSVKRVCQTRQTAFGTAAAAAAPCEVRVVRYATAGGDFNMGSTMLSEPRRKRKRTARAHASIRLSSSKGGGRRCCFGATAISLPCVAVLFGLGMTLIVGARKALKSSARDAEREGMWDTSAHPLAVLLMEQHEIDPQVHNSR